MNAGRALLRAIGGLFALGVAAVVLIPVAAIIAIFSIPVLVLFAVAGVVGAAALLGLGTPAIVTGVLILIAIAAAAILISGAVTVGVFALKVLLFALLLSWLARRVFGWRRPSSSRIVLVGPPVADIAAPSAPHRDKYDIAAERELDEELGL